MLNEKLETVLIQELSRFRMVLQGASAVSKNLLREYTREDVFAETILDEPNKVILRIAAHAGTEFELGMTGYAYDLTAGGRVPMEYEVDANDVRMGYPPAKERNTRLFAEGMRDDVGWYIEIPK